MCLVHTQKKKNYIGSCKACLLAGKPPCATTLGNRAGPPNNSPQQTWSTIVFTWLKMAWATKHHRPARPALLHKPTFVSRKSLIIPLDAPPTADGLPLGLPGAWRLPLVLLLLRLRRLFLRPTAALKLSFCKLWAFTFRGWRWKSMHAACKPSLKRGLGQTHSIRLDKQQLHQLLFETEPIELNVLTFIQSLLESGNIKHTHIHTKRPTHLNFTWEFLPISMVSSDVGPGSLLGSTGEMIFIHPTMAPKISSWTAEKVAMTQPAPSKLNWKVSSAPRSSPGCPCNDLMARACTVSQKALWQDGHDKSKMLSGVWPR